MCDQDKPRTASVYVHQEGNGLNIHLDTDVASYGEWIKREGGISLYRSQETKKVTGAFLPLYAQRLVIGGDNIPRITIDLVTGKVEVADVK